MNSNYIRKQSEELSRKLEENKKEESLEEDTDGKTEEGIYMINETVTASMVKQLA